MRKNCQYLQISFINAYTPHPSNMAQSENRKSLKRSINTDFDALLANVLGQMPDYDRDDPREEFPLPNAKRIRIIDSEDGNQTNNISNPQNLEVIKNPFNTWHYQNDELFHHLNDFDISNTYPFPMSDLEPVINDPLLNSYFQVNNSAYNPNESTVFTDQYYPDHNSIINDVPPNTSFSPPDFTSQLSPPSETSFNTSHSPTQMPNSPGYNSIINDVPPNTSFSPPDLTNQLPPPSETSFNTSHSPMRMPNSPGYNSFINDEPPNTSFSPTDWTNQLPPPSETSFNTSHSPMRMPNSPGYNSIINNVPPNTSISPPDFTNQALPLPKTSCNTPNVPNDVYTDDRRDPRFDKTHSILRELLTAPKPKGPKNQSTIHRLIYPSEYYKYNFPEDEITVLSHDKAEVTTDETKMPSSPYDNSVSGEKCTEVIESSIGNVVISYLLPTIPSTGFVPAFKSKKCKECMICHKTFENKSKLKIHMNTHTGNRPYICGICDVSFLRSSNLAAHRRIHNPKEYKCPHCTKQFALNSSLVIHIVCQVCITMKNMLEPTGKGWNCKECGEYLDNKSQFEGHLKKHKRNRHCPICFLDFTNVREHLLVSHVRRYHPTWLEQFVL